MAGANDCLCDRVGLTRIKPKRQNYHGGDDVFGYNYDGMGNRFSASKGTPALITEYEPDAMNRYATITSPGGDDILVKSATPVDGPAGRQPRRVQMRLVTVRLAGPGSMDSMCCWSNQAQVAVVVAARQAEASRSSSRWLSSGVSFF